MPAIPIQDLPSALPTNWAGTKGGKQEQKGENFHHLQLYFQFPPGTGGTGVNNHSVGFATFTKYKKYTHKLSRGDVAL